MMPSFDLDFHHLNFVIMDLLQGRIKHVGEIDFITALLLLPVSYLDRDQFWGCVGPSWRILLACLQLDVGVIMHYNYMCLNILLQEAKNSWFNLIQNYS